MIDYKGTDFVSLVLNGFCVSFYLWNWFLTQLSNDEDL